MQKFSDVSSTLSLSHVCCLQMGAAIGVGSKVKVMAGTTPSTGWGSVKASSVGTVKEMTDEGRTCKIDFPEQSGWVGVIAELELA